MNRPWFPYSSVVGWGLSILMAAALTMSAVMKLTAGPDMVKQFVETLGFPATALFPIGVTEAVCVLLYLYAPTSLFGAVLLAAYLGGACAAHVRLGEACIPQVVMGVLVWVGLVLRRPAILRAGLGMTDTAEKSAP